MGKRYICFYFQVHQPFRLRTYRFFDIGNKHDYYDDYLNRSIMRKVADKCYLPANQLMLDLIKEYGSAFKISFSISGSALDQFELYAPEVIESFQRLAHTGNVEFLTETSAHSLCSLSGRDEFVYQVQQHAGRIEQLFGNKPKTIRNTELIYSDNIGEMVDEMGYKIMLTEGAKHVLGWKSPNYMYCSVKTPRLKVLLKNYKLSDDIAFRFSNKSWSEFPLTAEKYASWLGSIDPNNETVNLFLDYETFGEHQWAETGIFDFMRALPKMVFKYTDFKFSTPYELSKELQPVSPISVPYPISWADEERDVTAWLGNELQNEAFSQLFALREKVLSTGETHILRDWLRLQNSDHFYYMCTKWFSDGEVHKYFNPYNSPYDAFINYMNVLSDFAIRVNQLAQPLATEVTEVKVKEKAPIVEPVAEKKAKPAPKVASKKAAKTKPDESPKTSVLKKKSTVKKKTTKTTTQKSKKVLTFDNLAEQPEFVLKELAKTIDITTWSHAFKNTDEEFRDVLLSFMGIRKLKLFEEASAKADKLKPGAILAAREAIMKKMEEIRLKKKTK